MPPGGEAFALEEDGLDHPPRFPNLPWWPLALYPEGVPRADH